MFERLTIRTDICVEPENNIVYNNPNDPEGMYNILDLAECLYNGGEVESSILLEISNRLAAYEDIGKSPEEIISTIEDYKDVSQQYANFVHEMQPLKEAKAEGRLVVLPCKVGAKIYVTINYPVYFDEIEETVITGVAQFLNNDGTISNQINTSLGVCFLWDRDFNNEVFLTREEAEKALKERENNDR